MPNLSRLDYLRATFIWRAVLAIWAIAGVYDFVVGQFASDWPRIADGAGLLSDAVPFYWWVISFLALLVAATFEGGYRQFRTLAPTAQEASHANLELEHEPGRRPYWHEEAGYHRVGISNSGPSSAERVEVTLVSIVPPPWIPMNPLPSRLGHKDGYCQGDHCEINKGAEHHYDVLRDKTPEGMAKGSVWGLQTIGAPDAEIVFREHTDYFLEVRITAKNLEGEPRSSYLRVRQASDLGLDIRVVDSLPSGLTP